MTHKILSEKLEAYVCRYVFTTIIYSCVAMILLISGLIIVMLGIPTQINLIILTLASLLLILFANKIQSKLELAFLERYQFQTVKLLSNESMKMKGFVHPKGWSKEKTYGALSALQVRLPQLPLRDLEDNEYRKQNSGIIAGSFKNNVNILIVTGV